MLDIDIPKNRIALIMCYSHNIQGYASLSDLTALCGCDLAYCKVCGLILKSRVLFPKGHFYLGSDLKLNILPEIQPNLFSTFYQPIGNTTEELVAALGNRNNQICSLCNGNKQIWDSSLKMMKDCETCNETGLYTK